MAGIGQAMQAPEQPGDQEKYNRLFAMAMMAIYRPEFIPKEIQTIQKMGPEAGIAQIASTIGAKIITQAAKEGDEIPPGVVLHAGAEIVKELVMFAEKFAGVEVSEQVLEDAFLAASENLKELLDREGFQFSGEQEPDAEMAVTEMAGGPENLAALRQRAAQARMPGKLRGMAR